MGQQVISVGLLHALNPEYTDAVARGELWALEHARRVESINSDEPEGMRREFDGQRRKWCRSACSHRQGCITCTLPENAQVAQGNGRNGGYHDSNENGPARSGRRRQRDIFGGGHYSGDGTDDDFI